MPFVRLAYSYDMSQYLSRSPIILDVGIRTAELVRGAREGYMMCAAAFLVLTGIKH